MHQNTITPVVSATTNSVTSPQVWGVYDNLQYNAVAVAVSFRSTVALTVTLYESEGTSPSLERTVQVATSNAGTEGYLQGTIRHRYWRVEATYAGTVAITIVIDAITQVPVSVDPFGNAVAVIRTQTTPLASLSNDVTGTTISGKRALDVNVANSSAILVDPNGVQRPTYTAGIFRKTLNNVGLVFGASAKAVMAIWPGGTPRPTRITKICLSIATNTTAGNVTVSGLRLSGTAAPTGGFLVVPEPLDPSETAAASQVRFSPTGGLTTTGGSDLYPVSASLPGTMGTTSTPVLGPLPPPGLIYDWKAGAGTKPLFIPSSGGGGLVFWIDFDDGTGVATTTLQYSMWVEFTET